MVFQVSIVSKLTPAFQNYGIILNYYYKLLLLNIIIIIIINIIIINFASNIKWIWTS